MEILQRQILSADGEHMLQGVVYMPEGEAKGYFQVVHGMREYIGRYDKFMREMAENGYICFGFDNLGHGKTAGEGELGYISNHDGWKYMIMDVNSFNEAIKREFGDKPCTVMGHSMGSFLVRVAAGTYHNMYDKLIVMGTAGYNPLTRLGKRLARRSRNKHGEMYRSKNIEKMAFGSYNKKFERDDENSWLSVDLENRRKYNSDPYCMPKFTISAMIDLLLLQEAANAPITYKAMLPDKPILLLSGEKDPVGNYSKGVKEVYRYYKSYVKDVRMRLFEGARHEILNDFCHDEVVKEILDFVNDNSNITEVN